jgi:hypothetical protein
MQSKETPDDVRGPRTSWIDWVVTRSSARQADERQAAVMGQVSSATLNLTISLIVLAGLVFTLIDSNRFTPLVLVLYAIVAGAGLFTKAAARRQAVDTRTMIDVPGWGRTLAVSIVAGGLFAVLTAVSTSASWRDASVQGAFFGVVWGLGFRFWLNRRRKAGLLAEGAANDDLPDTPASENSAFLSLPGRRCQLMKNRPPGSVSARLRHCERFDLGQPSRTGHH